MLFGGSIKEGTSFFVGKEEGPKVSIFDKSDIEYLKSLDDKKQGVIIRLAEEVIDVE